MSLLPSSLYLSSDVRELDRIAIEDFKIPGIELMERAGEAAWNDLKQMWPDADKIIVVCGSGNNAGDGYVLARFAAEAGCDVTVLYLSLPADLQGDASLACQKLLASHDICTAFSRPLCQDSLEACDLIVDAILGTGLAREVDGVFSQAITAMNNSLKPILSLDIPSGLNADTGAVMGCAIKASMTTSFIGLKAGLLTNDGREHCGELSYARLDVSDEVFSRIAPAATRIDLESMSAYITPRHKNAHKGHFGHALIIGGDYGYPGAIRMTAEAALRAGAGLVSVATRPEYAMTLPMAVPEVMAHGVSSPEDLNALLHSATVVAIGPGLGQDDWGMSLLEPVVASGLPWVADADALNLIAMEKLACSRWILTPHPGEAARLMGLSSQAIQRDRLNHCKNMQKVFDGVVVLKGSGTVICDQDGMMYVCSDGNPGMASGGMGDCLTGVIVAMLAQGYSTSLAARLGVCIHAAAADKAAIQGQRGLRVADLMPWIRYFANTHA